MAADRRRAPVVAALEPEQRLLVEDAGSPGRGACAGESCAPSLTAMPADSWPRCWRAWSPTKAERATGRSRAPDADHAALLARTVRAGRWVAPRPIGAAARCGARTVRGSGGGRCVPSASAAMIAARVGPIRRDFDAANGGTARSTAPIRTSASFGLDRALCRRAPPDHRAMADRDPAASSSRRCSSFVRALGFLAPLAVAAFVTVALGVAAHVPESQRPALVVVLGVADAGRHDDDGALRVELLRLAPEPHRPCARAHDRDRPAHPSCARPASRPSGGWPGPSTRRRRLPPDRGARDA